MGIELFIDFLYYLFTVYGISSDDPCFISDIGHLYPPSQYATFRSRQRRGLLHFYSCLGGLRRIYVKDPVISFSVKQ